MQESIAIVGSGMAGLAAARIFRDAGHSVTVFESQPRRGMDAHTLTVHGGITDVPLRIMSPLHWGSVLSLADHVGVGTYAVDAFISCNWLDGQTWFRSSRLPFTQLPGIGSLRYVNPTSLRMIRGLWQLSRAVRELRARQDATTTLRDFLAQHDIDPTLWRGPVLNVLKTICTCSEEHLLAWPALPLLSFLELIIYGNRFVRLSGGTPALVDALARDLDFFSGSPVTRVQHNEHGVEVRNARNQGGQFDRVIVATPTTQTGFLDQQQFARELAALAGIRFVQGHLVVHSDTRFLPRQRRDWVPLNFHMSRDMQDSMFTVWVNPVEATLRPGTPPVLQTWEPLFEPAPDTVLARAPLTRAVVHDGTEAALAQLRQLHAEPERRVFFCGSWAHPGVPLLESAVRSAVAVAERRQVPVAWDRA
jgi:predicted NAD/FAD-binding protein